jgi:dinuclear metal center YbgI/SA1388 family protein
MSCERKIFEKYLAELLDIASFEDASCNGLQVQGKDHIHHIATAVTASRNVIRQASELGMDALLVHHGLFFKGKEALLVGSLREKVGLLLQAGINLFAYHLPLDAHKTLGNNWAVAQALNWQELEPFGLHHGVYFGVKGRLDARSITELQAQVEDFYGQPARTALGGPKQIKSCALLSGGAHKWINEAIVAQVDCFITGTADEPTWHMAFEENINVLACGHAATEKIGVKLLGQHLASHFLLTHYFIDEPNPF